MVLIRHPVFTSQTMASMPNPPVTTIRPSDENSANVTTCHWSSLWTSAPVPASQIIAELPQSVTTWPPSGENRADSRMAQSSFGSSLPIVSRFVTVTILLICQKSTPSCRPEPVTESARRQNSHDTRSCIRAPNFSWPWPPITNFRRSRKKRREGPSSGSRVRSRFQDPIRTVPISSSMVPLTVMI